MPEDDLLIKKFQKEMSTGLTSLVLLNIIGQSPTPIYGYQVAKQLEARSANAPLMNQGALYPVLRSLEKNGLLKSLVEPSVSGPPRRYYSITPDGQTHLIRWVEIWEQTKLFVDGIVEGEQHEPKN